MESCILAMLAFDAITLQEQRGVHTCQFVSKLLLNLPDKPQLTQPFNS